MKSLPQTDDTPLIRTDFSDEAAWQALRTAVTTPITDGEGEDDEDGFLAAVHIVDDPAYRDLAVEQIVALSLTTDVY